MCNRARLCVLGLGWCATRSCHHRLLEVAGALERSEIGGGEISRASDEVWNGLGQCIEHNLGLLAGGLG